MTERERIAELLHQAEASGVPGPADPPITSPNFPAFVRDRFLRMADAVIAERANALKATRIAREVETLAADHYEAERDELRTALNACERYALRMLHDAGHPMDRQNAQAVVDVVRRTRSTTDAA